MGSGRLGSAAGLLALLVACGGDPPPPPEPQIIAISGETMGTTWNVRFLPTGEVDEHRAWAQVQAKLDAVNAAMSTWTPDSELSRARAADGPIEVSEGTALVVREALAIATATGGAFDPTVEPLVELWGFRGQRRTEPPTDEQLAAAREAVGYSKVTLDGRSLDTGGTALDLSAIAKGYGVDQAGEALTAIGIEHWMVEVGGEVRVHGGKPEGEPWKLGVDVPDPDVAPGTQLSAVVAMNEGALATSGNYRNFYELDDERIVHTLDPRVGKPVQTDVLSATVVAPDGLHADGWATALMVLGQPGMEHIRGMDGYEALLLLDGGANVRTDGFPAVMVAE